MTSTSEAETGRPGRAGDPRAEKVAVVEEVREKLSRAGAVILTEYRGLKVSELEGLRRSLRQAGGEYKVYKNTLVRFATRDLGLEIEPLLVGPTAIAFADKDVPGVAKALRDFSRTNPLLVVKGGVMGDTILTAQDAAGLADIAPREILLARLAGLIAAPMQQFAGLLQALPRNLAYGIKALIEQRMAAAPAGDSQAEPLVAEPVVAAAPEPATAEPATAEPAAAEPEPVATEPVATEPVATEPVATEPEPVVTEAVVAAEPEPVVTEAVVAAEPEPTTAEPTAAEPATTAESIPAVHTEPTPVPDPGDQPNQGAK